MSEYESNFLRYSPRTAASGSGADPEEFKQVELPRSPRSGVPFFFFFFFTEFRIDRPTPRWRSAEIKCAWESVGSSGFFFPIGAPQYCGVEESYLKVR